MRNKRRDKNPTLSGYGHPDTVIGKIKTKKPDNEIEKLKMKLRGKWPKSDTTDIGFDEFVEGILGRKTIKGMHAVETQFGDFVISKKSPEEIVDNDPSMIDIGYDGRKIIVEVDEEKYYIFGVKGKEEPEILVDVDTSGLSDKDAAGYILGELDNFALAEIIKKTKKDAGDTRLVAQSIKDKKVCENAFLGTVYLDVKTDSADYKIYLVQDRGTGREFPAAGAKNPVESNNRKYIVYYFKKEQS